MSNQDNLIVNVRERPVSTDLNNLESLAARTLAESLLYQFAGMDAASGAALSRNVVLGGLAVVPNGNNVDVTAGVLYQYSAGLVPVPGTYDSAYRFGRNPSSSTVVLPSPVLTTYYVLEAQVSEVTTSTQSRDILDTGTFAFVATMVPKVKEFRLTFQLVSGIGGGAVPTPTGGDWVPLAVIRRPGGGGAVSAAHICDVRKMWSDINGDRVSENRPGYYATGAVSTIVEVRTQTPAISAGVGELYVNDGPIDPSSASYLEPALVLAANTLYHLYLCPWNGLGPRRPLFSASSDARGVLVLSATAPTRGTRGEIVASAAINLPAPWTASISGDACVYVGSLSRDSLNTGWQHMLSEGPGRVRYVSYQGPTPSIPSGAAPQSVTVSLAGVVPVIAHTATALVMASASTVANSIFYVRDTGDTTTYDIARVNTDSTLTGYTDSHLVVPIEQLGSTSYIARRAAGTTAIADVVAIVGWTY